MFIGPFEHHSNILPWRESYADVVQISENAAGGVNADDLESKLKQYAARNLKIGATELKECFRAVKSDIGPTSRNVWNVLEGQAVMAELNLGAQKEIRVSSLMLQIDTTFNTQQCVLEYTTSMSKVSPMCSETLMIY